MASVKEGNGTFVSTDEHAECGVKAANEAGKSTSRHKKPSAAQQRVRRERFHRITRLCIQIAFFIVAPGLFAGAFNGVKYLFGQVGSTQPIEATSFLVLLVAVLGFTIVFGRFFCGYACAFGTLGDVLYAAFEFVRSNTRIPRVSFPAKTVRALSLVKYAVLGGICIACFLGVWSSVSGYSPWVAFAGFMSGSLTGIEPVAFALLALVAVGMIVRERFFCQFICPLGAVFSLMPILGFSNFTRIREHCARSCGRCHEACPVDIWPDADDIVHGECISCGRCANACPMNNVNLLALERAHAKGQGGAEAGSLDQQAHDRENQSPRPVRKASKSWFLVRGTETGLVIAKAVILLAICCAIGATRFITL